MKRANTAPLINDMEEQGLVERVAYKEDRRIQHLYKIQLSLLLLTCRVNGTNTTIASYS